MKSSEWKLGNKIVRRFHWESITPFRKLPLLGGKGQTFTRKSELISISKHIQPTTYLHSFPFCTYGGRTRLQMCMLNIDVKEILVVISSFRSFIRPWKPRTPSLSGTSLRTTENKRNSISNLKSIIQSQHLAITGCNHVPEPSSYSCLHVFVEGKEINSVS